MHKCSYTKTLISSIELTSTVLTALGGGGGGGGGGGVGGLGGIFFGIGQRLKLKSATSNAFNSNDFVVSLLVSAAKKQ